MKEQIKEWRSRNAARILEKAKTSFALTGVVDLEQSNPRLVYVALDYGSWHDQEAAQDMWAGLLVSSCSKDGRDESNLIFINILSAMTINEVRILNYACQAAQKFASPGGLIVAETLECDLDTLVQISGIRDVHRLDRELDHLRALGLFPFGFSSADQFLIANITPSSLALQMYVRCQGFSGSPLAYFGVA